LRNLVPNLGDLLQALGVLRSTRIVGRIVPTAIRLPLRLGIELLRECLPLLDEGLDLRIGIESGRRLLEV